VPEARRSRWRLTDRDQDAEAVGEADSLALADGEAVGVADADGVVLGGTAIPEIGGGVPRCSTRVLDGDGEALGVWVAYR
jgi:hypothetical protein